MGPFLHPSIPGPEFPENPTAIQAPLGMISINNEFFTQIKIPICLTEGTVFVTEESPLAILMDRPL